MGVERPINSDDAARLATTGARAPTVSYETPGTTTPPPANTPALAVPGPRGKHRRLGSGVAVAVVLALLAGLAAGVAGRDRVVRLLGLHAHARDGSSAAADAGKSLWTCSMHPQVIKDGPGMCPICHMNLEPSSVVQSGRSAMGGGGAAGGAGDDGRRVVYWWDPVAGPASITDRPGKATDGAALLPVYADELSAGEAVRIDPVVVQNMGVRIAAVTRGPVRRDVRAVGYLTEAQPLVRDVNLRVSGWVEALHADTEGARVNKGDPLLDLYSPEMQVAAGELIAARRAAAAVGPAADELARGTTAGLLDAARRKLELWGLDPAQVDRIADLDQAPRTVTLVSPVAGTVTRKAVVAGAAVRAGDAAFQIVDLSTLWLDARVHAQDLPFVRLGQPASADVEGVPGRRVDGRIVFVHPQIDPQTRTATIRMAVPNPDAALRPGMFATAHLSAAWADDAVLVPREAVIDTGTRQVAFVASGGGRFEPRRLALGAEGGDGVVQVLAGLAPGERVVTSGQFLLDAESRMREAARKHTSERLLAGGPPPPPKEGRAAAAAAAAGSTSHGRTTAPAPAPAVTAAPRPAKRTWSPELDRVFGAYLKIQGVLGAPQPAAARPVDAGPLAEAAETLAKRVPPDGDPGRLAAAVRDAAAALQGKPLAEQRALFEPLSRTAIALADAAPPSAAVAAELNVAYCPMAFGNKGGHWLQAGPVIANPYYATAMKRCGELKRAVETVAAPAGPR